MEISVETPTETRPDDAAETQLITYLQNILKVQIIPMKFSTLRELVAEAPKKMKLYDYIEDKYPDTQFLDFLRKYPNIFTVNRDRTVVLVEGNSFTKARLKQQENRSQDVVDGQDIKEYISDSESSEDDEVSNAEGRRLLESPVGDTVDGVRVRTVTDSSVSSISDSSVDVFSSEIVQTSDDSLASSCSSSSSLDN